MVDLKRVATEDEKQLDQLMDSRRFVRLGGTVMVVGFLGFLLWSGLAPIDEGVPSPGVVTVMSKRKTVQHPYGGIVQEILVRDGDEVKADQVLMRFNKTQAKSQMDVAQSQYLITLAVEARLAAESANLAAVIYPDTLLKFAADKQAKEAMALQSYLFKSRRGALHSELGIIKENIAGLGEQIKGTLAQEESKRIQLDLIRKELSGVRGLAEEGYVPRTKLYELERTEAYLNGSRSEDLSNIARARSGLSELKLRTLQRQQEYLKEVQGQLTEAQKERNSLRDKIVALEDQLTRTEVKSPADGYVVGLMLHTIGGVVSPGGVLMEVVPKGEQLVMEVQISPNLIDKVQPGLSADIRFSTVKQSSTPVVDGKVLTVGADRLVDERTNIPYYPAIVQIDAKSLAKVKDMHVQPGMSAEVIIKTGERTFLTYLFKPLSDRFAASLTEQ